MSRSLKKAPFVEEKLYNRVCQMNEKGEKKVLKTWSATSSASSLLQEPSRVMQVARHPITVNNLKGRTN